MIDDNERYVRLGRKRLVNVENLLKADTYESLVDETRQYIKRCIEKSKPGSVIPGDFAKDSSFEWLKMIVSRWGYHDSNLVSMKNISDMMDNSEDMRVLVRKAREEQSEYIESNGILGFLYGVRFELAKSIILDNSEYFMKYCGYFHKEFPDFPSFNHKLENFEDFEHSLFSRIVDYLAFTDGKGFIFDDSDIMKDPNNQVALRGIAPRVKTKKDAYKVVTSLATVYMTRDTFEYKSDFEIASMLAVTSFNAKPIKKFVNKFYLLCTKNIFERHYEEITGIFYQKMGGDN